jgi:hypothetical protein
MKPLLAALAASPVRANDPREEITEQDVVFDSTLVDPADVHQRSTTTTKVARETSDEN